MPALPPIPLARPDITQREIDAVIDVMQTSTLSIGPRVEEFEKLCAKVSGRRLGIGVSSGTAGLHACMLACGIAAGDEVITTPFSFVASTNCILYVGAKPVFVDIDPQTLNLDPEKVKAAITPRTRGIVAVEVFGHPGGMAEIEQIARDHDLCLIEDCCEAFGGRYGRRPVGSFGRCGVFGFYPNKQITTGEGGMIVTDDDEVARLCRSLRNQGRDGMSWLSHERLGFNYRLSEINAAIGIVQVQRLDEILENRRRVAHGYVDRLMTCKHLVLPTLGEKEHTSWFVFVVRLSDLFEEKDRDNIVRELRLAGIGSSNYFPPIHLQPYIAQQLGHKAGDFPVCEYVANRTIALPFFNQMTRQQIDRVCKTLEAILDRTLTGPRERF
jgi:dTDP-4-amino-4,6-dideoxygalactose transaminase